MTQLKERIFDCESTYRAVNYLPFNPRWSSIFDLSVELNVSAIGENLKSMFSQSSQIKNV